MVIIQPVYFLRLSKRIEDYATDECLATAQYGALSTFRLSAEEIKAKCIAMEAKLNDVPY